MSKNLGLYPHTSSYRKQRKKRVFELASVHLNGSPEVIGPYQKETQNQMPLKPYGYVTNPTLEPGMKSTFHRPRRPNMRTGYPCEKISKYLPEGGWSMN